MPAGSTVGVPLSAPVHTPVAIVGAGTAGMLAALALADAGARPLLLDVAPAGHAGSACPVHRLPEALWTDPPRWLRGLGAALRSVGATGGERHLVTATTRHRQPLALLPDKAMLDAALRLLVCGNPGLSRRTLQRGSITAVDGRWQLRDAADGIVHQAGLLVDATGARRASLSALVQAGAALPGSELSEGRQTYRTLALRQPAGQPRACWLISEGAGQAWLLDLMPDGAITLTERVRSHDAIRSPANGAVPDDTGAQLIDRLQQCLARLRLDPLRGTLQRAEPAGPLASYRAPSARRTLLAPAAGVAAAWLAVGDALVQTPPWLGQGVAQARAQAEVLADAWASAEPPRRTDRGREQLDRLAARQLRAAALAAWAEGDALSPA